MEDLETEPKKPRSTVLTEAEETEIRSAIVDDAQRSLRSTLSSNRRLTEGARDRFQADQRLRAACSAQEQDATGAEHFDCGAGIVSRGYVPFDVDGSFDLNGQGSARMVPSLNRLAAKTALTDAWCLAISTFSVTLIQPAQQRR